MSNVNTEIRQSEQRLREEAQHREQMLRAEMQRNNQALLAAINELRAQVQQSDQTLAALANHTHDADGRTVFQVPPTSVRKTSGSAGIAGRGVAVPSGAV